jgi:hypothetical protein
MILIDAKEAFAWTDNEYLKINKILPVFSGIAKKNISQIVSDIKNKDTDNDISKSVNWLKYMMPQIATYVYDGVLSVEDLSDAVTRIIHEVKNEIQITYDEENPENSSFNSVIDVFIDTGLNVSNFVQEFIKQAEILDKYWKPIYDTDSDDENKYNYKSE